ncbi:hypothetical protein N7497_012218 [Penicillium chrysogenum]|uniref:Uncharacterized protein n=1 Tax=Penicillium chrysogenum TaxID=5076 RepID=A0ABQ8W8V3_PENCH|nr:hypothetical protein N7505_009741 [Penicillium chrysogenum]KAJ6136966.1 hypothetical protein N7497_012218 [Penicillium chrysogenum]
MGSRVGSGLAKLDLSSDEGKICEFPALYCHAWSFIPAKHRLIVPRDQQLSIPEEGVDGPGAITWTGARFACSLQSSA